MIVSFDRKMLQSRIFTEYNGLYNEQDSLNVFFIQSLENPVLEF